MRIAAIACLVVGCGRGSTPPAEAPDRRAEAPASPEEQCLADAAAPRDTPEGAPESIDVSHILVRHAELDHPRGATRSRGEACLRALEALEALEGGGEWDDVVGEYSDAAGATMGALGTVSIEDVRPEFGAAAFSLEVDQLSYVVESEAGFHVILRTE